MHAGLPLAAWLGVACTHGTRLVALSAGGGGAAPFHRLRPCPPPHSRWQVLSQWVEPVEPAFPGGALAADPPLQAGAAAGAAAAAAAGAADAEAPGAEPEPLIVDADSEEEAEVLPPLRDDGEGGDGADVAGGEAEDEEEGAGPLGLLQHQRRVAAAALLAELAVGDLEEEEQQPAGAQVSAVHHACEEVEGGMRWPSRSVILYSMHARCTHTCFAMMPSGKSHMYVG